MKIKLKFEQENRNYNGYIINNNNTFIVKLEVPQTETLPEIIDNVKGFYDGVGIITMFNNQKISVTEHCDIPEISIYTYEANFVVYGDVDEETLLIHSMSVNFKESDYFFISDNYEIDYDDVSFQFQLFQDKVVNLLLENKKMVIKYIRSGGIKQNEYGEKNFINPAYINICFKEEITLNDVFIQLRRIESVLGFVFNQKINLIELSVLSSGGGFYIVVPPFQKGFKKIRVISTPIVDKNSLQLLKDVLKMYYSDKHVSSAINMYYEYLYNDLDNVFEFTSLMNTIELITSSKKYKKSIEKYTLENNKKLLNNNKKMEEVLEKLSDEQQKFIKEFYNFRKIELRDKIKYIFKDIFCLQVKCDDYISSIINTRNYFVHGTKYKNLLNSSNLIITKKLLRPILYLLIIYACSNEKNLLINVYEKMVPITYNLLISN